MSNHLVYNYRCVEVEKSGDNDQMGKITLLCRVKYFFNCAKNYAALAPFCGVLDFCLVPTVSLMIGIRRPRSMSFTAIPFKEIMIKSKTYSMVHLCSTRAIVATLHIYE